MTDMTSPETTTVPVTGSIFDADETFPGGHAPAWLLQRRCGLFLLHDINPYAVSGDRVIVTRVAEDRYRVEYDAIWLPDGQSQWDDNNAQRATVRTPIPSGVVCEHHGESHKVVQRRSFTTFWDEIALVSEVSAPDGEVEAHDAAESDDKADVLRAAGLKLCPRFDCPVIGHPETHPHIVTSPEDRDR